MFSFRNIKYLARKWAHNIIVAILPFTISNTIPRFPITSWVIVRIFIASIHFGSSWKHTKCKYVLIPAIA